MNLLRISRTERTASPLFIVGEARSGTTLLYRVLQRHPAFRPRKENLFESKLMKYADHGMRLGDREPTSMFGYLANDEANYRAFVDSVRPLRHLQRVGRRLRRRARTQRRVDQVWALSGYPLVVRSYFHHARAARGVQRILEKTPEHVHHVDRLLRCYPRARLIYVHRHPVDVYTSYVRRAQVDPTATWASISLDRFAQQWAAKSELAMRHAERLPKALLLVRYEEFTEKPDVVCRQICEFADESYDPEMIVEPRPNLRKRKAAPHLYGQITPKTKDWREFIDPADAARLQERLRPTMVKLGYLPYDV